MRLINPSKTIAYFTGFAYSIAFILNITYPVPVFHTESNNHMYIHQHYGISGYACSEKGTSSMKYLRHVGFYLTVDDVHHRS
jgi:hypothetical protein